MTKPKIYIAGCGGMLGEAFHKVFTNEYDLQCSDIDVNERWLKSLDFRDYEAYRNAVIEFKPDYLFHLGAHTSLEYCELNPDEAYITNTLAVENATHLANELKIPLYILAPQGFLMVKKTTMMIGIFQIH